MQKTFLVALLVVFVSSCGNQKAEQEKTAETVRIEQQRRDSIRLENERAEAARIQKEREEQARLEKERREWHGASSLTELKEKLDGTTWVGHLKNGSGMRFYIKNGAVHQNPDSNGDDNTIFTSYKAVEQTTNGNTAYVITFGEDNAGLARATKGIAFFNDATEVIWFFLDKPVGELEFVGRD